MNLLVTNTRTESAYLIIKALRPYAGKIVATMYGRKRWIAKTSHASLSRMVDARYLVPDIRRDWQSGIISNQNTPTEDAYVKRLLGICDRENIDVIFPSYDPQVYVLSKNKSLFRKQGVLIPIDDFDKLLLMLDKYRSVQEALAAGFPAPETLLPENEDDLRRFADRIVPPWVIRPRFTAGSKGMAVVEEFSQLTDQFAKVRRQCGQPMIQEYIPGNRTQNFYLTVDREGCTRTFVCPQIVRNSYRVYRMLSAAAVFDQEHKMKPKVEMLARRLSVWGAMTIQTKIDIRDNTPKLMEVNPRLGSHLWYRTESGINEPLICLKIAGKQPINETVNGQAGTLFLDPIEDFFALGYAILDRVFYKSRRRLQGRGGIDKANPPLHAAALLRNLAENYLGDHPKKFSPHFSCLYNDPLVAILWIIASGRYTISNLKYLGI